MHADSQGTGVSRVHVVHAGAEVNVRIGRNIQFLVKMNAKFLSLLECFGRQIHRSTLPRHIQWLACIVIRYGAYFKVQAAIPIRQNVEPHLVERDTEVKCVVRDWSFQRGGGVHGLWLKN